MLLKLGVTKGKILQHYEFPQTSWGISPCHIRLQKKLVVRQDKTVEEAYQFIINIKSV